MFYLFYKKLKKHHKLDIESRDEEISEMRKQIDMHDEAMEIMRKEATRSQLQALEAIHDFSRTQIVGATFEDLEDSSADIFSRREIPGQKDDIFLGQTRKISTRRPVQHHPASPVHRLKTQTDW